MTARVHCKLRMQSITHKSLSTNDQWLWLCINVNLDRWYCHAIPIQSYMYSYTIHWTIFIMLPQRSQLIVLQILNRLYQTLYLITKTAALCPSGWMRSSLTLQVHNAGVGLAYLWWHYYNSKYLPLHPMSMVGKQQLSICCYKHCVCSTKKMLSHVKLCRFKITHGQKCQHLPRNHSWLHTCTCPYKNTDNNI